VIAGLLIGGRRRSRRVARRERGPGFLEQLEGAVGGGGVVLVGVQDEAQPPVPALDVLACHAAAS
jgi:hypothetical protein